MINIKPKELQEKQFAKYKNYKKSKIDKTKTKTNDKKCKNKTKKNTMNEKRGRKITKTKLKSMHIQINKQKCILKLFCLVYLICI
jgi:hypothetical protein